MENYPKKYKSLIAKCLKANSRYDSLNDQRDIADDQGDEKAYRKLNRQCEIAFDKYLECYQQLPKYIQKSIDKLITL